MVRRAVCRLPALVGAVAVALALAAPAPAGAARHEADGRLGEWRGEPTTLAGRTQISGGELVYTDYLYDDYGPDVNGVSDFPQFRDALAPKSGDYGYPEKPKRYGYNAADLRELRVATDRRGLHLLIALQTMKVRDATVATVALDTDADEGTGAGEWPDGAGLDTPGTERFVTTWGEGARITEPSGEARRLDAAADLRANAIEVDIPWDRLGDVSNGARIWAVTGLAGKDGTYREQEEDATAAFDSAFQGAEQYGFDSQWGDAEQAEALASGDISALSERLRLNALRSGATRRFDPEPGYYNGIFRSGYSYGEGISLKQESDADSPINPGSDEPMFHGRYQPYALYIPEGYSRRGGAPLLLNGHSLDVNHNEYASVAPNSLHQLGDDRGSLIVTPLARGLDTWYLDSGLVDVFEAWRDARRRYNTDPDRTSITGYSMGGYFTYRLGLLVPAAFARASVFVGPPAYYYWPYPLPLQSTEEWRVRANTNLLVENGLNLPFEINHGNLDELVPIGGVVHQADTFNEAGNPYRFYHHQGDDHLTFIFADEWTHTARWLGDERRDLRPVRVRYRAYPSMDLDRRGVPRFDGAYWVDGLRVRDPKQETDSGMVDATTFALGGRMPELVDEGESASAGEGGATPAVVTGQHYEPGAQIRERNAFRASLEDLRAIEFLTARMGLDPEQTVRATLVGDGRTVLRFTGGWPDALRASLDGEPAQLRQLQRSIAVTVDLSGAGEHRLVIARR